MQVLTPDITAVSWLDVGRLVLEHSLDVARIVSSSEDPGLQAQGKKLLCEAEQKLAEYQDDPEGPRVAVGYITVHARNAINRLAHGYLTLAGEKQLEVTDQIALEWVRHGLKGAENFVPYRTRTASVGGRSHEVVDDLVLDILAAYDLIHPIRLAAQNYNSLDLKKKQSSSPTSSPEREILTVGGAGAIPT